MSAGRSLAHWLANRLPVYRKGHLYHTDGSLYMGRWALFETRWLSCRLHHLASCDHDRDMHDHPWVFASILLCGSYVEHRPAQINPHFEAVRRPRGLVWEDEQVEVSARTVRVATSIALRRPTDRHRISAVQPDTWSLFIYGPLRQWWGFYTSAGKIYWKDYLSRNEARP
jgi:hypothetical protein